MNIPTEYLIYGAVFLFVVLAVEALFLITSAGRTARENANRRMAMIDAGLGEVAAETGLRLSKRQGGGPFAALDKLLVQSGSRLTLRRLALLMIAITGAVTLASLYLTVGTLGLTIQPRTVLPHAVIGGVLGIAVPLLLLSIRRGRRLKRFQEQLPDALDAIVRGLKAGHPIASALQLVSEEMADPIGSEFGLVIDEMTYGRDLSHALENMADRIDLPDFEYFVVAVNIQHESGGNLAEILAGLSRVIRERFRLFKKVRALSAEGRVSAMLLSVLPFITGAVILAVNPTYYLDTLDDPLFLPGMGLVFVMMMVGIFVMYRMVNFRV